MDLPVKEGVVRRIKILDIHLLLWIIHSVNSLKYFLQYYIYLLSNRLFFSAAVGKKRVLGGRAGSMTNVSASFSAGLTEENDHEDYEEIKTK